MDLHSRFCELTTYTSSPSSGYNSTANSSLNYIDFCDSVNDTNSIRSDFSNDDNSSIGKIQNITKLVITITLVRAEQVLMDI